MEFGSYRTQYQMAKEQKDMWPEFCRQNGIETELDFYDYVCFESPSAKDGMVRKRRSVEHAFVRGDKAYYCVYPCVMEMVERLPDSTPFDLPVFDDLPVMLCDGPESGAFAGQDYHVQALEVRLPRHDDTDRVQSLLLTTYAGIEDNRRFMILSCDCGGGPDGDRTDLTLQGYDGEDGFTTVGEIIDRMRDEFGEEVIERHITAVRLAAVISLLVESGAELLERDVCKKDIGKPTTDEVLARMHKRKGNGWTLGRELESVPHTRRPHWAVRHMNSDGPGSAKVPRLRPIKGSIVKREQIEKVPSGFGGVA